MKKINDNYNSLPKFPQIFLFLNNALQDFAREKICYTYSAINWLCAEPFIIRIMINDYLVSMREMRAISLYSL